MGRKLFYGVFVILAIVLVYQLDKIRRSAESRAAERKVATESHVRNPSAPAPKSGESRVTDTGFYNARTAKHYSTDDMIKAMERINEIKTLSRSAGVITDCEALGGVVVVTTGRNFGRYPRAEREELLETLYLFYSAVEEVSRVEARSTGGRVVATYSHKGGYRES